MPGGLHTLSWTRFENPSLCSIRNFVSLPRADRFYLTFKVNADDTQGKLLYDLGDGQWDIPKLSVLLEKSFLNVGRWKITKSSMISRASAGARCS